MLQGLDICFSEFAFNQQKETISKNNPLNSLRLLHRSHWVNWEKSVNFIAGAIISNKQTRVASDSNMKYIL